MFPMEITWSSYLFIIQKSLMHLRSRIKQGAMYLLVIMVKSSFINYS